jgi:hypothetical protein
MKTNLLLSVVCFSLCLLSCNNQTDKKGLTSGDNTISQEADGTISLKLEKAACYSDANDPSSNTAEWTMSISNREGITYGFRVQPGYTCAELSKYSEFPSWTDS